MPLTNKYYELDFTKILSDQLGDIAIKDFVQSEPPVIQINVDGYRLSPTKSFVVIEGGRLPVKVKQHKVAIVDDSDGLFFEEFAASVYPHVAFAARGPVIMEHLRRCFICYEKIIVVDPKYYAGNIEEIAELYSVTDMLFLYSGNTFFEDNHISGILGGDY